MNIGRSKRVVEIAIDEELLSRAEQAGTDISTAAETGILRNLPAARTPEEAALRDARREAWTRENAETIRSYNDYINRHGLPWANYRLF